MYPNSSAHLADPENFPKKSLRGFASMNKERQRAIAQLGGRVAHDRGTAHEFTPEEARMAGRKGGVAVSRDRHHMALIGREGGHARKREQVVKTDAPPMEITPGVID